MIWMFNVSSISLWLWFTWILACVWLSVTPSADVVLSSTDLHHVFGGCWHCSSPAGGNWGTGWRETCPPPPGKQLWSWEISSCQPRSLPQALSLHTSCKPSLERLGDWHRSQASSWVFASPTPSCLVQPMVFITFPAKGPGPFGSFLCMGYRTCRAMRSPFPSWVHGLESWKLLTEILRNQGHG